LAVRLVSRALDLLADGFTSGTRDSFYLGLVESKVTAHPLERMMDDMDTHLRRPKHQWWLELRPVMKAVADATV
jgi:6-phosphofructokinase 1